MKVAIYSRTSTDRQQSGLEAQRRALEDYCKAKGIEDYVIYEDSGVSGTKSSRPELDKMMSEVRAKNICMVIVYSFSRFARSTKFLIDTLEEFGGLNVGFVSLTENLDLTTPIGKAMFSIIAALATLERDFKAGETIHLAYEHPYPLEFALIEEAFNIAKIDKDREGFVVTPELIKKTKKQTPKSCLNFVKKFYESFKNLLLGGSS